MPQQFLSSAERIVDAMLGESPALAQTAGDHTYDDCLPDWSPAAVADHVRILREAADALSQVDTDVLPPADAVDCTVLLARSNEPCSSSPRSANTNGIRCTTTPVRCCTT